MVRGKGVVLIPTDSDSCPGRIRVEALDWFDSYKLPSKRHRIWNDIWNTDSPASSDASIETIDTQRTIIAADVVRPERPATFALRSIPQNGDGVLC